MSHPELHPHVQAVVTHLRAAPLTVGNHGWPGTDPHADAPYTVVYLIAGGTVDGTLADPDDDSDLVIQLTSVGIGAEQALRTSDLGRAAMVGHRFVVSGRRCQPCRLRAASDGARRDPDLTPPLFYCVDRYTVPTFPA